MLPTLGREGYPGHSMQNPGQGAGVGGFEDMTPSAFPVRVGSLVLSPQSPECWVQPQGPLSMASVCPPIPVRAGSSEWAMGVFK